MLRKICQLSPLVKATRWYVGFTHFANEIMMWCYDQVDTSTKALQATASVCSCLKYFGKVVIGVARSDDKSIIMDMVSAHLW